MLRWVDIALDWVHTVYMTSTPYPVRLRLWAQSILDGIQRLEELGAEGDDDRWSHAESRLQDADAGVNSLVEWIEEGRP